MILIAVGANLPCEFGTPEDTINAAMRELPNRGVRVLKRSSLWLTEPVPASPQPWYRNGVAEIETHLGPRRLLEALKFMEREFGRVERVPDGPRVLDLDIVAWNEEIINFEGLTIPHSKMHERGFVLRPLQEIAPEWIHPVMKKSVSELIEALPKNSGECRLQTKAA